MPVTRFPEDVEIVLSADAADTTYHPPWALHTKAA
jgi:hypothetical protein